MVSLRSISNQSENKAEKSYLYTIEQLITQMTEEKKEKQEVIVRIPWDEAFKIGFAFFVFAILFLLMYMLWVMLLKSGGLAGYQIDRLLPF